jgi:ribose-phosphate pyrophosphokinase
MGVELGKATVTKFSDGEISVSIWESVRGKDCFIIQSTSEPVNDNLMELLITIDAMKRASAGRITAVMQYYGYARQDRKAKARDPITAKLVADMIVAAGADRVITMDLHAAQIMGFFTIPVDHLIGQPLLTEYYAKQGIDDCRICLSTTQEKEHVSLWTPHRCPDFLLGSRAEESSP